MEIIIIVLLLASLFGVWLVSVRCKLEIQEENIRNAMHQTLVQLSAEREALEALAELLGHTMDAETFRKITRRDELKKVLAIGIPAGIQGAIFSVSNVFIQSGINMFGEAAIAGSSLALNFEYFTYDIAGAFAQAAVTFTSQNFGAGNMKRCKKIFWLCLLFGFGFTEILSVIFIVWEDFFVSIYTTSAAVAAYGIIRMDRVCALEGLTATYEVASSCLRGTGKSLEPSVITILGTVVFRLIWLTTIFRMFTTYDMLMNVYVASWLFTGCSMFVVYFFHMRKMDKLFAAR